jgi:hypothetical protein
MNTKLTLKLDGEVVERAKVYAERRGLSLSRIVESYFSGLTQQEDQSEQRPTGVVAELTGLLRGLQIEDEKEGYAEYLLKKHS